MRRGAAAHDHLPAMPDPQQTRALEVCGAKAAGHHVKLAAPQVEVRHLHGFDAEPHHVAVQIDAVAVLRQIDVRAPVHPVEPLEPVAPAVGREGQGRGGRPLRGDRQTEAAEIPVPQIPRIGVDAVLAHHHPGPDARPVRAVELAEPLPHRRLVGQRGVGGGVERGAVAIGHDLVADVRPNAQIEDPVIGLGPRLGGLIRRVERVGVVGKDVGHERTAVGVEVRPPAVAAAEGEYLPVG